jgi:hypothetical protein
MAGLFDDCSSRCCRIINRLIDWDKSMAGVDEASVGNAGRAEVPIWAVETLMADAKDVLVTPITDSIVPNVAARSKQSLRHHIKVRVFNCRNESVLGVVAMLHCDVARDAKIVVLA